MEFPRLGQHCSEPSCKKLDFLPVKCDACHSVFCHDHMSYLNHSCPSAYQKDVQVPVCPLCNAPVPARRGEQPDIAVGAHIDNNCESDTAKSRRKVFSNKCSAKGCKTKELIPVNCSECQSNFCLKHRHPTDHNCEGSTGALRRKAAEAAASRQGQISSLWGPFKMAAQNSSRNKGQSAAIGRSVESVQGNLSEDEALARALDASMQGATAAAHSTQATSEQQAQEEEDLAYARALAESEQELHQNMQRTQTAGGSRDKCSVS